MGKCFIADVWMGIWATRDQTLSHPLEVQWPSECFPLQVFRLVWQSSSVCRQTPTLPRASIRAWKCSASVYGLQSSEKIRGAVEWRRGDLLTPAQTTPTQSTALSHLFSWTNNKWQNMFLLESLHQWPRAWILVQSDKEVSAANVTSEQICIKLQVVSPSPSLDWSTSTGRNCAVFSASVPFLLDISLFMTLLLQHLLWHWNHACSGFAKSLQIIEKRSGNSRKYSKGSFKKRVKSVL